MSFSRQTPWSHARFVWCWIVAVALVFTLGYRATAQVPAADAFNPGSDINGFTATLAVQTDGSIILGGSFNSLGGISCSNIGRLDQDGILDTSFPGANGAVLYCIAMLPDGKYLAGGAFTKIGGGNRTNVARLNSNGTLDSTFLAGPVNGYVDCFAFQPDGKILVGGDFTNFAGQPRASIARLNTNGTLDSTFNSGANGRVKCIGVQPDGGLLIAGTFSMLGGQPHTNIGRLGSNGVVDPAFTASANASIYSMAVQPDGRILVGGDFTNLCGQQRTYMGRLESNGVLDTTFNPSPSQTVNSIELQADGRILVGGWFGLLGGQPRKFVGRLMPDGSIDASFDPGASSAVFEMALQADGKILLTGNFTNLAGQFRNKIGRLNNTDPPVQDLTQSVTNVFWARSGTAPEISLASFEYSTNGVNWNALGNAQRVSGGWQVDAPGLSSNANVRARGYSPGCSTDSPWFVEQVIGPALILSGPVGRTNSANTPATFKAYAGGTLPITYQWMKDGVSISNGVGISGVDTANLKLSNVFGADRGLYSVVASNSFGSITSAPAILGVVDPVINGQPTNQTVDKGQPAALGVVTSGTAPAYQWRKNGTNLTGATAPTLNFPLAQASDSGFYQVVITNAYGSVTSTVATLTVNAWLPDSFSNPLIDPFNSSFNSLALQPNGDIVATGKLTMLDSQVGRYIGRFKPDGSLDPMFNPVASDVISC